MAHQEDPMQDRTDEKETVRELDTGERPPVSSEGHGPEEADTPGAPVVSPEPGGYAGRDPKTEMPRVPSVPETWDDKKPHGGAPDPEKEPDPYGS